MRKSYNWALHNTTEGREASRGNIAALYWEDGARQAHLVCGQGHSWTSSLDPRANDRAGVVDPNCPTCRAFYAHCRVVHGVYDESVKCGKGCAEAREFRCVCSCAGKNHGVAEALREIA